MLSKPDVQILSLVVDKLQITNVYRGTTKDLKVKIKSFKTL